MIYYFSYCKKWDKNDNVVRGVIIIVGIGTMFLIQIHAIMKAKYPRKINESKQCIPWFGATAFIQYLYSNSTTT